MMHQSSFKTAHPGTITFDPRPDMSPFMENRVCAKQVYHQKSKTRAIIRMRGQDELKLFLVKADCFWWASILLDLIYQFIACKVKIRGEPPHAIPSLCFARVLITIIKESEKA